MITLVVLLTCADYIEDKADTISGGGNGCRIRYIVWLVVLMIGISRLLISSHFIYQIICGVLVGITLHKLTTHILQYLLITSGYYRVKSIRLLSLAGLMIILALSLFHVWTWFGMDPGFSIPLAKRYVYNRLL